MTKLSIEEKKKIVKLRLEQGVPKETLAIKYGINNSTVQELIRKYKIHGDKIFVKQYRTFTPEIKLEVINRHLSGEPKSSLAIEYNIKRTMIDYWIKRYEENGYNGLKDKPKGRPAAVKKKKIEDETLTETERLIKQKDERILELEAEVEALKKLRALVLQRNAQQQKKKQ